MLQQVPLASIGDTVVTLAEVHDVPPGELHSQHVEQPGQSWAEWPTNSLWGALAGVRFCSVYLCTSCGRVCPLHGLSLIHHSTQSHARVQPQGPHQMCLPPDAAGAVWPDLSAPRSLTSVMHMCR